MAERLGHHRAGCVEYPLGLGPGQRLGGTGEVQPRSPQRLVGVDVADAGDQRLVEKGPLHAGPTAPQRASEGRVVERRVEWVEGDVGDLNRHAIGSDHVDGEPAECALIDEAELPAVVLESEPDSEMRLVQGGRRLDEQLPTHAEVPDDGALTVDRQPEVLAASARSVDLHTDQGSGEVGGTGRVPPDRARVQHLDRGDAQAGDMLGKPSTHDLDLGQLGHRTQPAS